jgi:hypothetical protein
MPVSAQTSMPVGIMPFAGDDAAINQRIQDAVFAEVGNQEGFTPWLLESADSYTDLPPEGEVVAGMDYVLTGERYFDDEESQRFQAWLWNAGSGALVYTDELVADNTEEIVGYLPALVRWVFSKIIPAAVDEPAEEEEAEETGTAEKSPFPRLYLGLWGAGSLDFQTVRPSGSYAGDTGQSFSGAGAVTAEYRPWQYLSFQAEGIFVRESFAPFRQDSEIGLHTTDHFEGMYLLFPLLAKASFELNGLRLSPMAGLYYILPLRRTVDGVSYNERLELPLGVMAGFELGYALNGGKWGEVFGSIRYGSDLGLTTLEERGLRYTRSRLVFSLGWRFGLLKK